MLSIISCLLAALTTQPKAENWTPKRGEVPATAFPDLKIPQNQDWPEYEKALAALCPRILGDKEVAVEAGDDMARKLLKARLHQGRLELSRIRLLIGIGRWDGVTAATYLECLGDTRSVALELWADEPKTLIPWLEEFVLLGKDAERLAVPRRTTDDDPPSPLNYLTASRHRLAAESALWKAKNPPRK